MLFRSFAFAAVCGFLLSATPTWSGGQPIKGRQLGIIVGAWIAGRAAMWLDATLHTWLVALFDLALIPALTVALWPVLTSPKSRKNLIFLIVLGAFFAANLMFHFETSALSEGTALGGLTLGVHLLALLIVIVIGRIVPTFIAVERLATEGPKPPLSSPALEWLAIVSVALVLASDLIDHEAAWVGLLALAAAAIQIVRILKWRAGRLLFKPQLAALHVGYAWIITGLALMGFAYLDGPVPVVSALHAITVGGVGTIILAVMSIVSLLHTGRPAKIHPLVILAYMLVSSAALLRTLAPIIFFESYQEALIISGALWACAFGIFVAVYWKILTTPRPDGIPG